MNTTFPTTQAEMRNRDARNNPNRFSQERTIYKLFAASKMSDKVKPMTVVEFTDFLGKKHQIPVKNKRQMREAQELLAQYKKERAAVNAIVAEYPMVYGRVHGAFIDECANELKAFGIENPIVSKIMGY